MLLLVALSACDASEQDVEDGRGCPDCVIELDRIATLRFTEAPASPTPLTSRLEQLPDSSFLISVEKPAATLLHYSVDGSYIDSHLRPGQGPGELDWIESFVVAADSVWVLDRGSRRCSVYDSTFTFARGFQCPDGGADAALYNRKLYFTGFGPMGLVEIDVETEERRHVWEPPASLPSDNYSTLAAGSEGIWLVPRPHQYRLTYWLPGETSPARVIERSPAWWQPVELFVSESGDDVPDDEQRMAGPFLFNVGVRDGFLFTASYVLTRPGRTLVEFLQSWVEAGAQGDVRVVLEALTPRGELIAAGSFDELPPPRFTSNGLVYTVEKEGLDVQIGIYRPLVVPQDAVQRDP